MQIENQFQEGSIMKDNSNMNEMCRSDRTWQNLFSKVLCGLKLNIQKTKIMASGSITSWEIDRETVETVSDFNFLGSKITQMVTAAMKLKDAYSLEEKL